MDRSLKNLGWKKRVRFLAKEHLGQIEVSTHKTTRLIFEGMHIFMDTVQTY